MPSPIIKAAPPASPPRVVPPAPAGEVAAELPIARLLEYGATFGKGRVSVTHLPSPLPLSSGRVALGGPFGPWHELARTLAPGVYRLFAVVRDGGPTPQPVAVGMYCGRPPIARYVHAHRAGRGKKAPPDTTPLALDELVIADAAGAGADEIQAPAPGVGLRHVVDVARGAVRLAFDGKAGARPHRPYWGLGPDGAAVCLVIDLGVLTAGEWKSGKSR